jgi:hypothetical protein
VPPADIIDFVILELEGLLPDVDEESQRRLTFIMEQLGLCLKEPKGRIRCLLADNLMDIVPWQCKNR